MRLYDTARGRRWRPRGGPDRHPVLAAASPRTTRPTSGTPRSISDLRHPAAAAPRPRPRDPVRAQRHRRGRRHPAQGPRARGPLPRPGRRGDRPVRLATWQLWASSRLGPSPGPPAAIAEILTLIGRCSTSGLAYEAGGSVYFDVTTFPGFGRSATSTARPCWPLAAEHGGQPGRPQQAPPARLRAVAAVAARRAVVGVALGTGPTGVAHRVLGPRPPRAGRDHRRPRRRTRPGLSPPRVRRRPSRSRSPVPVRAPLAARRPGRPGRHQDVQVPRQPGLRGRPAEGVGPAAVRLALLDHHYRPTGSGREDMPPGSRSTPGATLALGRRRARPTGDDAASTTVRCLPRRRPRHAGGAPGPRRRGGRRPSGGPGAALLGITL